MKRLAILALLLLAACGKQGALTPVPPRTPPVAPVGVAVPPTAEEMLVLPPQSAPARVDDPVSNSQARPADRFNLPPN
ncbi:hypothetical protein [Polymorphobacter fuscus]|uniref:Argininosuccinate lyase n=1 Tax=Sandarakinorhabdus fusca TaxID=1439888 RepID=A0A7C9GWW4_9SPHN|nr:hypothetical protein [Polymorphobacter fuscus]KAB7647551.1 hypothetical protein F9290_06045 [Polymorphobacter fuscus]MQT16814.1 hypothetical protein [Polymorphobacter fuscus]NJC09197.1 putative small lipoprotein YifL [Polymorphobacter fuscus]